MDSKPSMGWKPRTASHRQEVTVPVLSTTIADRNLLFGILALQMDFIQREALIAAMHAWVLDKTQPLGEILVRQGSLSDSRRQLLESLVDEHVEQHQNDVRQSLIAVAPTATLPPELRRLNDTDLMASLCDLPAESPSQDPFLTLAAPQSQSAGTRFRIVRPHAQGGLGQVSIAIDEELHREVALKEIRPLYADHEQSRARFVLEAEITGNLEHPGIVPIYGLGSYDDGRPYYAMRLIRGETLEEAIARFHRPDSQQSSDEARSIRFRKLLKSFVDACNAIGYAHSRRVLHRDIKPANIMLCRYGETLVVDWGLAKPLDHDESAANGSVDRSSAPVDGIRPRRRQDSNEQAEELPLRPLAASGSAPTQFGVAVGTPQFMSPEQAAGQVDQLGPASDVYSLGATLYCLLTGRPPLVGCDLGETLRRVQRGDFPSPRQVNKQVPPPLEAICLKAMSLVRQDRYASATELADDVERYLADEPVTARVETWHERLLRWFRQHRTWTEAAAMSVLAVAAVAVVAALVIVQAWSQESEARTETAQLLVQEKLERENALRQTERAEQLRLEAMAAHRETEAARHTLEETQTELARQITHLGLEEQLRRSVQSKPLLWEIAADRIEPLYPKSRQPGAHDHSMQTYSAFRQSRRQTADIASLQLLPLGELSEADFALLETVRDYLARFYDLPTVVLKPLDRQAWQAAGLDPKLASAPSLPAAQTIQRLVVPRQSGNVALLGLTRAALQDETSQPTLECRDGQHPAALASLSFLQGEMGGAAPLHPGSLRRVLKLAASAAGGILGIEDFAAYDCGMNAASNPTELDARPLTFCPECEQKIWLLGDVEPLERYRSLIDFARRNGLEAEAAFWERAVLAIRGESGQQASRLSRPLGQ
jgi:serine/threonine protein kinase